MLRKLSYILFLVLLISTGKAQEVSSDFFQKKDNAQLAHAALKEQKLDDAKKYIDLASEDPEIKDKGFTLIVRSTIYKDLYKLDEKGVNRNSPYRIEALNSAQKVVEKKEVDFLDNANKIIKYLAQTLYNDAATMLNSGDVENAKSNYALYKKYWAIYDPTTNFKEKDFQFKLVEASVYTKMYEQQGNKELLSLAQKTYREILAEDSLDVSANYHLGILYYNEAVAMINNMDYDVDLVKLSEQQDFCISLFKQALPYMKKAYTLNPTRKETLIGLSGIYFSLNDTEKFELYKHKIEELGEE